MTNKEIEKLRQLAEKAIRGPWFYDREEGIVLSKVYGDGPDSIIVAEVEKPFYSDGEATGSYIATFHPQMILDLLDEIEKAREKE